MAEIIVAVDGPAGSGKSSVCKAVAAELGYCYLDTGAGYRSLAWWRLENPDLTLPELIATFDYEFNLSPSDPIATVSGVDVSSAIRTPEVTAAASQLAGIPEVREFQVADAIRRARACSKAGVIVEGRDVTTVSFTHAQVRVLMTASEAVRISRRGAEGGEATEALVARDRSDSAVVEFLKPAEGVQLLDTSNLTLEQSVSALRGIVRSTLDERAAAIEIPQELAALDLQLEPEDLEMLATAESEFDLQQSEIAPVIAIVGRPNVGKSALLNRIVGRREAIVEDKPGVTRDRVSYPTEWAGRPLIFMDTGGWEPDARGLDRAVAEQAELAIELADAVVLVVDATVGATATDERVVSLLRASGKPVLLAANKVDDAYQEPESAALWSLGLGQPHPVSAVHGRGVADFLDSVVAALPPAQFEPPGPDRPRRVALIGRPNVGKSSLLNLAAGRQRAVVSEVAGTTRDPIDEDVRIGEVDWHFIDTAGIRKRVRQQQGADFYASLRTAAALERSEVALVLLEASETISEADIRIIQMALDSGRSLVIAFNKWDLIDEERRLQLEREIETELAHVDWAPRVNLSAKTGRNLEKLNSAMLQALAGWDLRVPTGKVNAFFAELQASNPHPVRGGKQARILFASQVSTRPPKFLLFATGFLEAGYRRFLARKLRENHDFTGTPLTIAVRVRERRKR
ncbi:MAG: hypothetical protein RL198_720 [Actinomycetota bacterium]